MLAGLHFPLSISYFLFLHVSVILRQASVRLKKNASTPDLKSTQVQRERSSNLAKLKSKGNTVLLCPSILEPSLSISSVFNEL
jgi:hypothetical protein